MKYILTFVACLFLIAAAPSPWDADQLIGKKAPEFILKDVSGRTSSLSAYKSKVVLLCFWATWCPPCRSEMPSLNKLYKDYRDKGLAVIGVSTDRKVEYVKDYLSKYPVDFPVLIDSDTGVSRKFGVFSMPTSFLLDKNGVIIKRFLGEEDWNSPEIRNVIKAALAAP